MKYFTYCIFTGIGALLFACQEDIESAADNTDEVYAGELATDEAMLEGEIEELWQFSEEAATSAENSRIQSSFCATRTVDIENNTVVLDFGEGCIGPVYGRVRKGKVLVQYQGNRGDAEVGRTITFDNYSVNTYGVSGTIEASREDSSVVVRTLTDLTITHPTGQTTVLSGTQRIEWLEGRGDGNWGNDLFEINGTISGSDRSGRTFTSTIVEPVVVNTGCDKYLRVSGVKEVTTERNQTYTINFGDGACDDVITVVTPRRAFEVTLR